MKTEHLLENFALVVWLNTLYVKKNLYVHDI